MPRKAKKVDLVARLEAMSKDESYPLAMREEAAKELLRLTLKDKPAPAPAPAPARVDDMSLATFVAALESSKSEHVEKPRVTENLTESQAFAIDQPERDRRAKAAKDERERLERIRQAEANRPETVEEYQARRRREQARASQEWYRAMGCPRMEFDEGLGRRP